MESVAIPGTWVNLLTRNVGTVRLHYGGLTDGMELKLYVVNESVTKGGGFVVDAKDMRRIA